MRNLWVLAGGVLLILGVTGCSQDSDKSKQEAAMSDSVKLLSEYADAIESVKDKQTGMEAGSKINKCCDKMEELAGQSGEKKPVTVVLSGQMSPLLQQQLQSRGWTVQERAVPGPLK